jgi:hypothetical protein
MSEIINFYEKIPKDMLDTAENPNKELHNLNLPFRMVIVAPSGSGKSNFLVNLIYLFCQGNKGTFETIHIITRNKDEPLYNFLSKKCESIIIKEGIESLPPLDKFDKKTNHLVCFDDLQLLKNQDPIMNYYIRARKKNCSVIYLAQNYYQVPKVVRCNCSYLVILKLSGARDAKMILSELGLGLDKETLMEIYEYATREKFSPLVVDMEADKHKRFRKGLKEIINWTEAT